MRLRYITPHGSLPNTAFPFLGHPQHCLWVLADFQCDLAVLADPCYLLSILPCSVLLGLSSPILFFRDSWLPPPCCLSGFSDPLPLWGFFVQCDPQRCLWIQSAVSGPLVAHGVIITTIPLTHTARFSSHLCYNPHSYQVKGALTKLNSIQEYFIWWK